MTLPSFAGLPDALLDRHVHIWVVRLRASETDLARCAAALSDEELKRANRFLMAERRCNFLLAHGCARALLGRYLDTAWNRIVFRHDPNGKPHLAVPETELCFNQSDSGDWAAFAFTHDCQLGVDIERLRPLTDPIPLARSFLSAQELAELAATPAPAREAALFSSWTRKEAYVKATGFGLQTALNTVEITFSDQYARLVYTCSDPNVGCDWQLHSFRPAVDCVGALAYRGERRAVDVFSMEASQLLDGVR